MFGKKGKKAHDDYFINKLSTFQIRLPEHLKDEFIKICEENDSSGAKELRKFIKKYISNNGSEDLFKK